MQEYKQRIKNSFSKAAATYDQYASVQKEIAVRLIDSIQPHVFQNILEIGCGTGNYTKMLQERFPSADITAIDFSSEMISVAAPKLNKKKGVRLFVDDAEEFIPETGKKYDLITSNSTFQWFADLKKGLEHYHKLLADRGMIIFSMMGPETFYELYEIMKDIYSQKVNMAAQYFMRHDEVKSLLHAVFKNVEISETVFTRKHENILDLLKTIKHTGVNIRRNGNGILFTPALLEKAENDYIKRFGGIKISYQVFLCEAGDIENY
ncbi:MAG: malonyl-ACP O-methyltransferase BioC [Desulfobacterales bacterium]|nr:malonyl-ACP O-methyltransferase BioC [Desulfobacterales bacterium]